jgi:hypothetical protein
MSEDIHDVLSFNRYSLAAINNSDHLNNGTHAYIQLLRWKSLKVMKLRLSSSRIAAAVFKSQTEGRAR